MVEEKVRYEEAGRAHRYFLGWRHAAFGGYLAGSFAVLTLAIQTWEKSHAWTAVVLLAAAPIGLGLLFADLRIRDLYFAAVQAGKAFEGPEQHQKAGGVFTNLSDGVLPKVVDPGWGHHTIVAAVIYGGYSIAFLAAGIAILVCAYR